MTINVRREKTEVQRISANSLQGGRGSLKRSIRGEDSRFMQTQKWLFQSFCYRILHNHTRFFEEALCWLFQPASLESITSGSPMRVFELLFQKWRHIELEFDIGTIARDLTNPQQTVYVMLASVSPASAFAFVIYRNLRLNRTIDINVKDEKYLNCLTTKNY